MYIWASQLAMLLPRWCMCYFYQSVLFLDLTEVLPPMADSMISWVLIGLAGAPIAAANHNRAERFFLHVGLFLFACRWPWFMYACIGVAVGLLLVAVLFLIVATVSARFKSGRPFVSARQLRCLRATNCMVRSVRTSTTTAWHVLPKCTRSQPVLWQLLKACDPSVLLETLSASEYVYVTVFWELKLVYFMSCVLVNDN